VPGAGTAPGLALLGGCATVAVAETRPFAALAADPPYVPSGGSGARFEHATCAPRIAATPTRRATDMWVILLEALGALVILLLIVWWTMFAGRDRGERK
jgi:hypothetical protein